MTTGANNFKPFAVGGSANALSQAAYEALTTLIANGFLDGVADSAKVNKVLRQAVFGTAVLGEIIAANGVDALDDGDLTGFKTKLLDALNAALSITVPDASTTVKGKVELSTNAETISGISDTLAVTPAGLAAATAADVQRVKGWLNFNGTLSGTITPRAALNVTSVTKSATGTYVANLTTAMANANYAVCGSSNGNSGTISNNVISQTTTSFSFQTFGGAGGLYDGTIVTCAIFGN